MSIVHPDNIKTRLWVKNAF